LTNSFGSSTGFSNDVYSYSYIRKILRLVNAWGYFICRKQGRPLYRIPLPRGHEKRRLLDAYFEKTDGAGRQSEPLSPQQLEGARPRLSAAHYRWIYLSVWLGLRPAEVDQLKFRGNVQYLFDSKNTPIISVYQTKLMSVPPRYRWKLIPLFLPEQKRAIDIIRRGRFERPPTYLVKRIFGPRNNLYAGRKGFTDLMLAHEQRMDHISQWMGHSTLQRTWTHYKNRLRVHYSASGGSV
jgi:integrase